MMGALLQSQVQEDLLAGLAKHSTQACCGSSFPQESYKKTVPFGDQRLDCVWLDNFILNFIECNFISSSLKYNMLLFSLATEA
jgi:hypothetical protein